MALRRAVGCALAFALGVATPRLAHAQNLGRDLAKRAYQAGEAAAARGDYEAAAVAFAEADQLEPNDVALESALEAAVRADDAPLGMELVERSARNAAASELPGVADARSKFASRTGRVVASCGTSTRCDLSVDGKRVRGRSKWVVVGAHRVVVSLDGGDETSDVAVEAGASIAVPPEKAGEVAPAGVPPVAPPPSAPPAPPKEKSVVGDVVFYAGIGVTTVLASVTFASFGDVVLKHEDFAFDCEQRIQLARCPALKDAADAAQLRTQILAGVTGASALGAVLVGIFAVDWSSPEAPVALDVGPQGAAVVVRGAF
jgi:hypothetical protein